MRNRTRRIKVAELLLDLVKYILTITVIGGYFAKEKLSLGLIVLGAIIAVIIGIIAIFLIPPDKED